MFTRFAKQAWQNVHFLAFVALQVFESMDTVGTSRCCFGKKSWILSKYMWPHLLSVFLKDLNNRSTRYSDIGNFT